MYSRLKLLMICLSFMLLGAVDVAKADHITGGEIYYTHAGFVNGSHNYLVTMKLFMRCNSGRNFPNPAIVSIFEQGSGARIRDISVVISRNQTIRLDTIDPCIGNPPSVCYDIAYYDFNISLPPNASGYYVVGQVNFRISNISNLGLGNSNVGATYVADIPGTAEVSAAGFNNSAQFTANDLVVVCSGTPINYSFAATDRDNDQLRYYFCDAYQTGTSGGGGGGAGNQNPPLAPPYNAVPYGDPYNGGAPLGENVRIDPITGVISGLAPNPGIYIVTVCVEELRNNIAIATQRKDIQINVTNCSIAAAVLPTEYLFCKENTALVAQNGSNSTLIQFYSWQLFNNNGTPINQSATPVYNYTFADTGLYTLKLFTNQGIACPDSAEALVRVYPGMETNFTIGGTCFGRSTDFSDASTTRYGTINSWRWNFGEPTQFNDTAISANPFYLYPTRGLKNISLITTNTNGCRDTLFKPWDISDRPLITLAFKDTLICPPDSLQLSASGTGVFTWSPEEAISIAQSATTKVAPLTTTLYTVTLDQDGCINSDTVLVRVTDRVLLQAMPDTTICLTDSVRLRITTNATAFEWNPPEVLNNSRIANPTAFIVEPTLIKIRASISQCFAIDSVAINPVPYPTVDAGPDFSICFNTSGVQLQGSSNASRIEWMPTEGLSNSTIPDPMANPINTTTYILAAYNDSSGCNKPGLDTVLVQVIPRIDLVHTPDTNIVVGQPLQLFADGADTYRWSPADNLTASNIPNPIATFNQPTNQFVYRINALKGGCETESSFIIRVFPEAAVYVPTAFTPNADGLNDVLKPTLAGIESFLYFRVYNRYGQLVFETNENGKGWDGLINGKPQPAANFIWMLEATSFTGDAIREKGTVMLIR